MSVMALPLMIGSFLHAQDLNTIAPSPIASEAAQVAAPVDSRPQIETAEVAAPAPKNETEEAAPPVGSTPKNGSRWFVRMGILGALYHSRATIAVNGTVIPGSTARVTNNTTMNFDIGYDISDKVAVMMMAGIPPRPAIIGGGTVSSLGKFGAVDFGPVILTGIYRLPERHRIRPYVGAGAAHVFILGNHDAAITRLNVHDNWGFVLQAGLEFRLNKSWGLFADYKRLWLYLNAEGRLAQAPVRARETLDPDLVSAGLKFHFH